MTQTISRKDVEIAVQIKDESGKAWRLSDGIKTEWVPKTLVRINFKRQTVDMPRWLAEKKGFI